MSQAGIFDLPNREDSTPPELPAVETESSELPQPADLSAVARFEQRISLDRAPGMPTGERLPRLKEADWFSLARKLRQRNRDLIEKVAELEQLLDTARESLQVEMARSRSVDTLNGQQVRELEAARAKISWLYGELEASHQAARERSRNIEQLSQQLETAGDRIAALERECSLLQQHCQEQSCRVEIAEQLGRDLASRLECQQHRTLQFKAALDKCLERSTSEMLFGNEVAVSEPLGEGEDAMEGEAAANAIAIETEVDTTVPLKTQPIQPWSAREGSGLEFPVDEFDGAEPAAKDEFEIDPSLRGTPCSSDCSEPKSDFQLAWESSAPLPDNLPAEESPPAVFEPIEWEVEPTDSDTFDAIFETLDEGADLTVEAEELLQNRHDSEPIGLVERLPAFALERTFEASAPTPSNFPAPIVYPHRRERKHRSLATIDLPNFRR